MTTIVTTLLALAAGSITISSRSEIVLWSMVAGVDPALAQAVEAVESGHYDDVTKDTLVSLGNYGRFQLNCTVMKRVAGYKDCTPLRNRHVNIRLGIAMIAAMRDHFAAGNACRCGGTHHWIAHYNQGWTVTDHGERYARNVVWRWNRLRKAAGTWAGW